jgi:methylenetetrahydrofolate dehydrogenase (NADP+) / methenyltetrahydrofolate cyclohydrolase
MSTISSKTIILEGAPTAKSIIEDLSEKIKKYTAAGKRKPALAVLLVGNDQASEVYVKNKIRACGDIGIKSHLQRYDSNIDKVEIMKALAKLNADDTIDGILVQLPLPSHVPTEEILAAIAPDKDVDGLHPYNLGLLFAGRIGLQPCTPKGIMALLSYYKIPITGKHAVVIGRSNLVGKPVAALLLQQNATVTICHSKSTNLPAICKEADILVVAAGQKQLVDKNWVKPGACVIDVGIHRQIDGDGKAKLVGDVLFDDVKSIAGYITPVPGGVGKMTVAMLMVNTVFAYEQHLGAGARLA